MRKDWDTLTLCDRFFDAIERKDYETLETCYAPEAVIWHSHDCLYQPRAANLAMLKDGMQRNKKTRFRDGMISRAYEYFDTGQIEKFLGPRAGSQTAPDR